MQILQHMLRIERVSGWSVFFDSAPVQEKSQQQNCVTLAVTEAELTPVYECAQDMIRIKQTVTYLGLKVQTPMKLFVDNHGLVDLVNKWSVSWHMHHVAMEFERRRPVDC